MKGISMSADPTLPRADPVTVARQLGWTNVEIIDDDLSRSGGIARPLTRGDGPHSRRLTFGGSASVVVWMASV
jgi:hypothetical protein